MTDKLTLPSAADVSALADKVASARATVESLEEAAKVDLCPRAVRLQVMLHALERDLVEARSAGGAAPDTAAKLYDELRREATDFSHELGAISQGAPTTVSAVGDAAINAIEAAVKETARVAAKVSDAVQEGVDGLKERINRS